MIMTGLLTPAVQPQVSDVFWVFFFCCWFLLPGLHPVVLWESSDAAGKLHHPRPQADGEPAAAAGERGQDPVLYGPCHQLLPCGQGHRQDHQRGVRREGQAFPPGPSCHVTWLAPSQLTSSLSFSRPTGRLDEYLSCIAKIQKAVEYFQDNNPDSPELNTVVQNWSRTLVQTHTDLLFTLTVSHSALVFWQKARFEKGKELLEAEFRSLLTRYSKPVPPILILDAITVDEELEVQEEVVLEHLPEAVLQDVICIAGWLVEYGRNQGEEETPAGHFCDWLILNEPFWTNGSFQHFLADFMNVYFQIRSNQLDRSIKGLKDHFRKNSASSGILYSPAVQTKRKDTPTKKAPKRPGQQWLRLLFVCFFLAFVLLLC